MCFICEMQNPSITHNFFRTEQYSNFEDPFVIFISSINMIIIIYRQQIKDEKWTIEHYGELTQIMCYKQEPNIFDLCYQNFTYKCWCYDAKKKQL